MHLYKIEHPRNLIGKFYLAYESLFVFNYTSVTVAVAKQFTKEDLLGITFSYDEDSDAYYIVDGLKPWEEAELKQYIDSYNFDLGDRIKNAVRPPQLTRDQFESYRKRAEEDIRQFVKRYRDDELCIGDYFYIQMVIVEALTPLYKKYHPKFEDEELRKSEAYLIKLQEEYTKSLQNTTGDQETLVEQQQRLEKLITEYSSRHSELVKSKPDMTEAVIDYLKYLFK